jgi:hypothetical protein
LNSWQIIPVPPADGAFFDRPAARVGERLAYVLPFDVLTVYVVERPVVGLGDYGEAPVFVLGGARFDLGGYKSVAHHADAVGVGDRDRCGEHTGLADPLEVGHLPVTVEAVGAREDGVVAGKALAGTDDGHTRTHRPLADHERPFPPHDGRVPDAHAFYVGDRIVRAAR